MSNSTPSRHSRRTSLSIPVYSEVALAMKSSSAKPRLKRSNIDQDSTLSDLDEDNGPKKRIKSSARAVVGLPTKKQKPIKVGLNPLPQLYSSPCPAKFTFPVPPLDPLTPRTAFVFGEGGFGQHGLGTTEGTALGEIKRPRLQAKLDEMIMNGQDPAWARGVGDVELGGMHTLCVDTAGRVWSWGINDNAALGRITSGDDAEELESSPNMVQGLKDFKAVAVDASDSVSLALSDRGEVRCWGSFRTSEGLLGFSAVPGASLHQLEPVALPNLSSHTLVQLATGDDHFLALTTDGHVFACGNGEQHQLGRKIIARHKTHGLTPERLSLKNIVLIGSGSYHSFAVSSTGVVYSWGLNSFHQSSPSDAETIETPTPFAELDPSSHDGARVVQIAGGEHHSIFLFSDGSVWACGRCDGHEVGLAEDHEAMRAATKRKADALAIRSQRQQEIETRLIAAGMTAVEARSDSERNAAEEIPLPNPFVLEPTRLSFPVSADGTTPKIVDIASGTRHNLAIAADGTLYAWGVGQSCQLGLGDEEEAATPEVVKSVAMKGFRAVKVRTGGQHSFVVAVRGEGAKASEFGSGVVAVEQVGGVDATEVNGNAVASGSGSH